MKLPNGSNVSFTLCQKAVPLPKTAQACTYCMLPMGHSGDCVPEPSRELIQTKLLELQQAVLKNNTLTKDTKK